MRRTCDDLPRFAHGWIYLWLSFDDDDVRQVRFTMHGGWVSTITTTATFSSWQALCGVGHVTATREALQEVLRGGGAWEAPCCTDRGMACNLIIRRPESEHYMASLIARHRFVSHYVHGRRCGCLRHRLCWLCNTHTEKKCYYLYVVVGSCEILMRNVIIPINTHTIDRSILRVIGDGPVSGYLGCGWFGCLWHSLCRLWHV